MAIFDRIKTPLPQKLHPAVKKAVEGGEIDVPGKKLPLARLEVWDEAVNEAQDIAQFQLDDGYLEERADRWAFNEPGRVYNDRRDSYLDGGLEGGELLSYSKHVIRYTRIGEGTIDRLVQNNYGDGRITHSHLNLKNPSLSYHVVINSEGKNEKFVRDRSYNSLPKDATTASPGIHSLKDSLEARGGAAKAIFLNKTEDLASYRLEQQKLIKELMTRLPAEQQKDFKSILKASRSTMPMELFYQAANSLTEAEEAQVDTLKSIRKQAGNWASVESIPEDSADGLTQNLVSYVTPKALQLQAEKRDWEFDDKTGLPIADSVVIGAGPGGLASGYHLANTGARTLIFEAKSAGHAFSDDNAKSVKSLRTSVASTDILGSNWRGFEGHEASLRNQYPSIIENVENAQAEWTEATGEKLHEAGRREHSGPFETAFPRAGLYDHMQRLASGLTKHYPDTFLIERSPVKSIKPVHDDLFEVTTHNGHKVLTRTLVPSSGFVGKDGELAKQLPSLNALAQAEPEKILTLHNDNAEMAQATQIAENIAGLETNGKLKQALIASDRKLGSQDIRSLVAKLPKGSRIGFVGGGESGVKGVLEAARLNPEAAIDFYVSRPLEPYQTQVPAGHLEHANIKAVREHPELKAKTLDLLKTSDFGSPVTTSSLGELFALVGEGRVNIHNLGTFFDENSVHAEATAGSTGSIIRVNLKSDEAKDSVKAERQELANSGLLAQSEVQNIEPADLSILFTSVGYDIKTAKIPDYMNDLVSSGLFDSEKGSLDSRIVTNSAGFATDTADTALAGRAIQGWDTPETLANHLPKRETPKDRLRDDLIRRGTKISRTPKPQTLVRDEIEKILDSGARSREILEELLEEPTVTEHITELERLGELDDAALASQDPLRILNQMERALPEYLSPAEKELVRRGRDLLERITDLPSS